MNIYPEDRESWDKFNRNMSDIFDVEYISFTPPIINFEPFENNASPPWNKGMKLGEDWSNVRKNYTFTAEQYEKVISHLTNLRKTMYTKERAEKISKSLRGYKMSEERKQNISKSKIGKKLTPEQKIAKSEAMKRWHLSRKEHIHKDSSS
jgi:hypothetical protein